MVFQKGESGNVNGRPAAGLQAVADRMAYFLSQHTIDEIYALVRNKKAWGKLTAIDGVIVRRIHAALQKAGSNPDFTAVLDRFVGRPVQPIAAEFKVTHGLADRIEKARKLANAIVIDNVLSSTSEKESSNSND